MNKFRVLKIIFDYYLKEKAIHRAFFCYNKKRKHTKLIRKLYIINCNIKNFN